MPLPADKVELLIGGQVVNSAMLGGKMHDDWKSYEIDSDLLIPADAWNLEIGLDGSRMVGLPSEIHKGAPVQVCVGGEKVLTGLIDEINHPIDKHSHTLTLSGRDGAAVLVDCSAPIFVARMVSLDSIVAKIVSSLGITKYRIDADVTFRREKINIEPGDTAWEALSHAAEANGLWPWFEPDGRLVVGGPDYSTPPVADLIMRYDGKNNNLESLAVQESITERFSELTVLGQTHGTETEEGKNALHATAYDAEMKAIAYRPKIIVDHESDNTAIAKDRARKLLSDARLKSFTLTAQVKGHRIVAPGQPADGRLWTPGQRVRVFSDPHNIKGIFFVMGRKLKGGRSSGTTTILTLKEDGMWVLDAHPHKRKHRFGNHGIMDDYPGATP